MGRKILLSSWVASSSRYDTIILRPHEDDPQKVCVVIQVGDGSKVAAFMAENAVAILESSHLLETTESKTYL